MEPSTTRMKGAELALRCLVKRPQKVVAIFQGEKRIVEIDLRNPRNRPSTMSSMLGWVAAVMAMVSPSHPDLR